MARYGFVKTMCRCWLQTALDEGCLSWDIIIHKVLTVVVQASLMCRGGKITLSKGYKDEYLRWSHSGMKLAPTDTTIDGI